MAQVFQIIATDSSDRHFEPHIVDDVWHTSIDSERTLCGLQTEGDDGYGPGESVEGVVTCALCLNTIRRIRAIKDFE